MSDCKSNVVYHLHLNVVLQIHNKIPNNNSCKYKPIKKEAQNHFKLFGNHKHFNFLQF